MKRNFLIGALCASFAIAAPSVQAITLTSFNLNGNDNNGVLIDQSILGIDVGIRNLSPLSFTFTKGPNSLAMYDFSSIAENLSGSLWGGLTVSLIGGAYFSPVMGTPSGYGSVVTPFNPASLASVGVAPAVEPTATQILFNSPGEPFGVNIGNPFGDMGLSDFQISLARVAAGDSFTVEFQTAVVPVPGALVLLLSGLAGFGVIARRKKSA